MTDAAYFLRLYDEQLRTEAETPSAVSVDLLGPLRLATFDGGQGFITYRDLGGADADAIERLVPAALEHYRADPAIGRVEWKTRGHDHAPGLHEALVRNGFAPDDPESIMIGAASALAVEVPLPAGVTVRRVTAEKDVRAMSAMSDEAFGEPASTEMGWRAPTSPASGAAPSSSRGGGAASTGHSPRPAPGRRWPPGRR